MRDFIIFIIILTGFMVATSSITNSLESTTTEDIEKPHVKIPGS